MKLAISYIEQILGAVENHPQSRISQRELLAAIGADSKCEDDVDKFYHHMKRLQEAGFLFSPHRGQSASDGFGFLFTMPNGRGLFNTDYELTWEGHRYLEAIRSDTIGEKARQLFLEMSVDQFKQKFPALLSSLINIGSG